MLRLFISGLVLSSIRRSTASHTHNTLPSRALADTCRNLNIMEQPLENRLDESNLKCDASTETAAAKSEEPALPKLSAQEFRGYNRMVRTPLGTTFGPVGC